MIVFDPNLVLNSLTREVKEVGPNGQKVNFFVRNLTIFFLFITMATSHVLIYLYVTKVVPAISEEVKDAVTPPYSEVSLTTRQPVEFLS